MLAHASPIRKWSPPGPASLRNSTPTDVTRCHWKRSSSRTPACVARQLSIACRMSRAAVANIVASLETITNRNPRSAAARAAVASPTAVPHGMSRARHSLERAGDQRVVVGVSSGKPARQRQVTRADEQCAQPFDGQDLVDHAEPALVLHLHAPNDAVVAVVEIVRRRRRAPNVRRATCCRARVRQWD